ncbi:YesL family protein [Niallia nealsonii]|uniref:DUF624 domain-containing protein n=1 Tax=Niallia nealsonii TaxID=115979 RepID=A0A2N0YWC2_9BACI|nr:DUF624 domain-containing protein [Niallia nealsonii]PKG21556.1 hypothetical protein CWS01_21845 [Niallia nealsonii]
MNHIFEWNGPLYRFLLKICELMLLNCLFLLFCLPIITIGASTTALYAITLKMVRNEEVNLLAGFIQAVKKNFKQSTAIWIFLVIMGSILYIDYSFLKQYAGPFSLLVHISLFFFSLVYLITILFVFPYISRFKNSVKESIGNTLKMAAANPIKIMPILIISLFPVVLMLISPYLFVFCLYLSVFLGFSFIAYLNSFFIRNIYERYES